MTAVDNQHLERILDRVQGWTRAADTKAEILGLMQTATAALLADDAARWFSPETSRFLKIGMVIGVGLWLSSVVMTAFAILANIDNPQNPSFTFFGDIANKKKWASLDAYRLGVNRLGESDVRDDYIDQIYVCSMICGDKYWYVKRGIWLFLLSGLAIEITLVLSGMLAARLASINRGQVASFNGEGVLMAFAGDGRRTNAARCGYNLAWFNWYVLKPQLHTLFVKNEQLKNFTFQFGTGIYEGKVLVVRGGIKGANNNDLIWVGEPPNYSVKLSDLSHDAWHMWMFREDFLALNESMKCFGPNKAKMWTWANDKEDIVKTNWWLRPIESANPPMPLLPKPKLSAS